jgi:isoquinoline 1-oxidoreductase alpha subunit
MVEIRTNGRTHEISMAPDTPLLWVLREELGLTGTKFSCGKGLCGACHVHIDGSLESFCLVPVAAAAGAEIITIEGLAEDPDHPVLKTWGEEQVTQCGYCQSGQIMATKALLARSPHPTDDEITRDINGNLCRCGTYPRIRRAIHRTAGRSDAT